MSVINTTPLVDVMLVLLIIFMVTAPLMTAGVPVQLPDSRAGALDQEQQPVNISIDGQGQVFVGEDRVSDEALPDRLLVYTDDGDEVVAKTHERGLEPVATLVRRSTLEDVFLRLTGRTLVD